MLANRYLSGNSQSLVFCMLANRYPRTMRNDQVRLQNLRALVEEFGTIAEVGRLAETSEKYLWQILNGVPHQSSGTPRGVGKKLAQKLEQGCGKPEGWLDHEHTSGQGGEHIEEIVTRLRALPADHPVIGIIMANLAMVSAPPDMGAQQLTAKPQTKVSLEGNALVRTPTSAKKAV